MKITAGESTLVFDKSTETVTLEGSMRLANLIEYEVVKDFLNEAYSQTEKIFTLDFTKLRFLNSSGITTISMFIIAIKRTAKAKVAVLGTNKISWQEKSLGNFNKLWSEVDVRIK